MKERKGGKVVTGVIVSGVSDRVSDVIGVSDVVVKELVAGVVTS